jgi:hypothetical protein
VRVIGRFARRVLLEIHCAARALLSTRASRASRRPLTWAGTTAWLRPAALPATGATGSVAGKGGEESIDSYSGRFETRLERVSMPV